MCSGIACASMPSWSGPTARVWIRIRDWEDWRFHWPGRYRDVFRPPDTILVGEELRAPRRGIARCHRGLARSPGRHGPAGLERCAGVDPARPGGTGRQSRPGRPGGRRTHRLWGRIAAKEAARRLWLATGDPPRFPADLAIVGGMGRPPRLRDLARPESKDLPAISIAHAEGVAIALAARNPDTPVGIDIEPIIERAEGTDTLSLAEEERSGATDRGGDVARRVGRAVQAAKAGGGQGSGLGPAADPAAAKVVRPMPTPAMCPSHCELPRDWRRRSSLGDHPGPAGETGKSRLGMDPGGKVVQP